jgi:microcystin-dependent protein
MPRDSSGNYTLPTGNPVVPGTIIEADWANTTMDDEATELTSSLDRQGRGGMQAPLRLIDGDNTNPALAFVSDPNTGLYLEAGKVKLRDSVVDGPLIEDAPADGTTYARKDAGWLATNFGAYTPLGIGSVVGYSGDIAGVPTGWLDCDGRAVSRATYPDLDALYDAAGYPYGNGDGTTTFNLPNLSGRTAIGVGTGANLTARTLGEMLGEEDHTLTQGEMPTHSHAYNGGTGANVLTGVGVGVSTTASNFTTERGGDSPHNTMQPSTAIYYVVKALEDTVAGGPGTIDGHVIQDASVTYAQRANLRFEGAGVTVTDDVGGDASLITIPGGGGGGAGTLNEVAVAGSVSIGRGTIRFIEGPNIGLALNDDAGEDESELTVSYTGVVGGAKTFSEGHSFVIGGGITAGMAIGTFFVPLSAGQSTVIKGAQALLSAGTATVQLLNAGGVIASTSLVAATPTSVTITGDGTIAAENDPVTLAVEVADVNANDAATILSYTFYLESTI